MSTTAHTNRMTVRIGMTAAMILASTAGGCSAPPKQAETPVVIQEVTPVQYTPVAVTPEPQRSNYPSVPGVNEAAGPEAGLEDSTSTTQVTFAQEGGAFDPAVSRDGKFVVFASTQHRPTSDIYIKPIRGRALTQLTNDPGDDIMPVISPDGSRVAFASNRGGNWDIFVMPVTGGAAVQVTNDAGHDIHASWSPDGAELVFSRLGQTSGRWELWTVQPESNGVSRFIGFGMFPTWCPVAGTGQNSYDRIAFQLGRERGNRAFGIWTIDYKDGQIGALTQIDSSTDQALINPSWSPDGQRLVFTSIPSSDSTHASGRPSAGQLWMIDADGANRVRLTAGTRTAGSPVWTTPTQLLFVSDRSGVENIWSLDMANPVLAASGSRNPTMSRQAQSVVKPAAHAAPHTEPAHGSVAHAPAAKAPAAHAPAAHAEESHEEAHAAPAAHAEQQHAEAGHGEEADAHADASDPGHE